MSRTMVLLIMMLTFCPDFYKDQTFKMHLYRCCGEEVVYLEDIECKLTCHCEHCCVEALETFLYDTKIYQESLEMPPLEVSGAQPLTEELVPVK